MLDSSFSPPLCSPTAHRHVQPGSHSDLVSCYSFLPTTPVYRVDASTPSNLSLVPANTILCSDTGWPLNTFLRWPLLLCLANENLHIFPEPLCEIFPGFYFRKNEILLQFWFQTIIQSSIIIHITLYLQPSFHAMKTRSKSTWESS